MRLIALGLIRDQKLGHESSEPWFQRSFRGECSPPSPRWAGRMQEATSDPLAFHLDTMQARQLPSGPIARVEGLWQRCGITRPRPCAASQIVVPSGTVTSSPSREKVTVVSVITSFISASLKAHGQTFSQKRQHRRYSNVPLAARRPHCVQPRFETALTATASLGTLQEHGRGSPIMPAARSTPLVSASTMTVCFRRGHLERLGPQTPRMLAFPWSCTDQGAPTISFETWSLIVAMCQATAKSIAFQMTAPRIARRIQRPSPCLSDSAWKSCAIVRCRSSRSLAYVMYWCSGRGTGDTSR